MWVSEILDEQRLSRQYSRLIDSVVAGAMDQGGTVYLELSEGARERWGLPVSRLTLRRGFVRDLCIDLHGGQSTMVMNLGGKDTQIHLDNDEILDIVLVQSTDESSVFEMLETHSVAVLKRVLQGLRERDLVQEPVPGKTTHIGETLQ